jgi:ATP-dependent RNA helicase MSS116
LAEAPEETTEDYKITKFQELADQQLIHPNVIDAITANGLETMTDVQTATINQALRGTDM